MIQEAIFNEIAKKVPAQKLMAGFVSETLGINNDAAYRRIRGETELGLDEAIKLCSRFNVSLDSISGNTFNNLIFRYHPVELMNLDSYRIYLRQFTETVVSFMRKKHGEIDYTAEDVPLFQFLQHRELVFFNLFVWFSAVSGSKLSFERFLGEIEGKESLFDDFDRLANCYCDISSCEIWTVDTIDHLLRMLEYYYDMGVFTTKETVRLLFRQLHDMTDKLEQWTETGKKEGKGDFKLYVSATNLANNYILLKNEEDMAVGIRLYTVKSILTYNPDFCKETEKWIKNMMKKSTLLSGTSERERARFFQQIKSKIDGCQEKMIGHK